jgi:hypothetical protein
VSETLERRQFGRRNSQIRWWLKVPGRRPVACVVANISRSGAFLELPPPNWLPFRFGLVIEPDTEELVCEIRHVREAGIGIKFCTVQSEARIERKVAFPLLEADQWTGGVQPDQTRASAQARNRQR